jgi:alpha-methylacyl-CoA racemase
MTSPDTQQASRSGPLAGLKVVDLSRLAPGPYCSMLLGDLGADVVAVGGGRAGVAIPELSRGKRFIGLDLKSDGGRSALRRLIATADVFIEGFRPGVADRIGAGYAALSEVNPRLVYCSLTGYGQTGPRAQEAGHDINYLAISGILGTLGSATSRPEPPLNLLADFAAGGMAAAIGILAALLERGISGRGQYVDVAMVRGCRSLMAMIDPLWQTPVFPTRGEGLFGAPFYRTYRCADAGYVAVGAIERGFFEALWRTLGDGPTPDHMNLAEWPRIASTLSDAFRCHTREHWAQVFVGSDACVTAVLSPDEVVDEHRAAEHDAPAGTPLLANFSRTPGHEAAIDLADRSIEVLREVGLTAMDIARAIPQSKAQKSGLDWPPVFGSAEMNKKTGGNDAHREPGGL